MAETIQTYPSQITGISGERQAVVLVLLAHREDADGNIQQEVELAEGETLTLTIDASVVKNEAAETAVDNTEESAE